MIALLSGFLYQRNSSYGNVEEISFTDFQKYIAENRISKDEPLQLIVPEGRTTQALRGTYEKGKKPSTVANAPDHFKTTIYIEYNRDFKNELESKGYKVDIKADSDVLLSTIFQLLSIALPIIFVCVSAVRYLLPWIVALFNTHPAMAGIFILNLLLGWTVIGWIIALIWAVTKPQPPQQVSVTQQVSARD